MPTSSKKQSELSVIKQGSKKRLSACAQLLSRIRRLSLPKKETAISHADGGSSHASSEEKMLSRLKASEAYLKFEVKRCAAKIEERQYEAYKAQSEATYLESTKMVLKRKRNRTTCALNAMTLLQKGGLGPEEENTIRQFVKTVDLDSDPEKSDAEDVESASIQKNVQEQPSFTEEDVRARELEVLET